MPIVKKNDVLPERPVIIGIIWSSRKWKTSVATTALNPLLIDCDRGADRAVQRCDTIMAKCWKDIDSEREAMKEYKTIVVDTAKSMIDDYLSQYAIENNYKLKTNALKRFGQMGEDFKEFVNFLRSNGSDIVFICHDKETADGDVIKHSPDCTGQSKDLLVRIADQVGYVFIQNGKRCISFAPLDNFVGKNVAGLETVVIPDYGTTEFDTCMSDIILKVKTAILGKGEAQAKANEQLASIREQLSAAMTDEDILALMEATKLLPKIMQVPFFSEMQKNLAAKGYTFDKDKKLFVKG